MELGIFQWQVHFEYVEFFVHGPQTCVVFFIQIHHFTLGRPAVWYWGLIQVYSIVLSFASLLQTCVQFNEWPKRRHTPHKLLLVIPYFTSTIAYRASAIALLGAFVGEFAAVPLVLIALAQVGS